MRSTLYPRAAMFGAAWRLDRLKAAPDLVEQLRWHLLRCRPVPAAIPVWQGLAQTYVQLVGCSPVQPYNQHKFERFLSSRNLIKPNA